MMTSQNQSQADETERDPSLVLDECREVLEERVSNYRDRETQYGTTIEMYARTLGEVDRQLNVLHGLMGEN